MMPADVISLVVFLGIGLIAGSLASLVLGGSGLLRNLAVGVIGSVVGGYLLSLTNVQLPIENPWIAQIVTATIGAVVVIAIARIIAR